MAKFSGSWINLNHTTEVCQIKVVDFKHISYILGLSNESLLQIFSPKL